MASPSQSVSPLRISKGTGQSPTKIASSIPRPLSELAPTEKRRNSPSFKAQTSPKKTGLNTDSSPFQSSPFNASEGNSSPRLFWQAPKTTPSRFSTENGLFGAQRDQSPSPTRRSSIERLQRASRVKNSNMFAREQKQEYDPTTVPVLERPLAKSIHGNAFGGSGLEGLRSSERQSGRALGHQRTESKTNIPLFSPTKSPLKLESSPTKSPSKEQSSPTKSSLSSRYKTNYENGQDVGSEENSADERELPAGRYLHRHAKSVTFDAAPPQINEYEMTTPDVSSIASESREGSYDSAEEEEDSYLQGDFLDQEDSFDASLEDTDKTPVVGPEDWRHGSPMTNRSAMISGTLYDPFSPSIHEGSPMPEAQPSVSAERPIAMRNDSLNSNGEHRPLPPLPPGTPIRGRNNSTSSTGISGTLERVSSVKRNLPLTPRPASISKSEIQGMDSGKMPLEERLRLMMIQDDETPKTAAELQRERRLRRGAGRERNSQTPEREKSIEIHEDEDTLDSLPDLGIYQLPPRISRESILRKANGEDSFARESDYNFSSPPPSSSPERAAPLDPDTPLPSTEDLTINEEEIIEEEFVEEEIIVQEIVEESMIIKSEPGEEDDEIDVFNIPEMYQPTVDSAAEDSEYDESVIHRQIHHDEDEISESEYSDVTPLNASPQPQFNSGPEDDEPATPRAASPVIPTEVQRSASELEESVAVAQFGGFLDNNNEFESNFGANDFGLSMQSFMTPSPPLAKEVEEPELPKGPRMSDAHEYLTRSETPEQARPQTPEQRKMISKPEYDGTGWGSDEEDYDEPSSPDSVIRHPMPEVPPSPARNSPTIPDQVATIKSSGSKLKTRPSATPSDLMAMREMRRQVSAETGNVPPIPERHRNRPSMSQEPEGDAEPGLDRNESFKKRSLTLDIGNDLGLGLDKDFDRVIEAQKRGYLMRQNTKVVVASSDVDKPEELRGTRSAGNSPIKKDRPQTWTVEPWNGQVRKGSLRDRPTSPRKKPVPGAVPPMPGHSSNAHAMIEEEPALPEMLDESGERGRLFVKVVGVKDLGLPLPKNEKTWFSLTLDNGVHCVTTAWLELGKNAPIGQEFELVVPNELEFQLTLNAKLVKPLPKRVSESPAKSAKAPKASTFSRVFASPKKRKELEMKQREEEERLAQQKQRESQAKRQSTLQTGWDLLSPLTAEDGSFGRSYICLKDHESKCFGRPYNVDIACFNEWATEEVAALPHYSSLKNASKRGNAPQMQRRAPYKVAKLELQLLFVPKPKGATDEEMPKSMNSCIREMKEAEMAQARSWEGHLSQQGGDCPFWRRRYFKLHGNKLTAYHESTRQPRATINLSNASKLIDDRRALTQKETTTKGGKRRKSGFADDEEGYMFVEEGFRVRFNNGEVIDFYADTGADKEGWMNVLEACIGKDAECGKNAWCDMILKREERQKAQSAGTAGVRKTSKTHARVKSMIV